MPVKNKDWKLIGLGAFFVLLLAITYSNHFNNGFHFDDNHTIVSNTWIRDITNIPQFFVNHETVSIYPRNQGAMRPVVTSQNAIDYWLGGNKLVPKVYHIHIFIHYLLLCVLLYFLFLRIFNLAYKGDWNRYIALICTAWFALHTANAETVNYVIARSDLFSTLMVVMSLLLFTIPKTRKNFIYLLPFIVALFTKEVTYVYPFVLFFFVLLFDEEVSIPGIFQVKNLNSVFTSIKKVFPPLVLLTAALLYLFLFYHSNTSNLTKAAGQEMASRMNYFLTQSYVLIRYMGNFFMPINLSADPDITIIKDINDLRVVFGILQLLLLAFTAVMASLYKKTRPVTLGIIWFYFFLAPTSSFNVMYQISNDHRTFVAYIGLIMAFGWLVAIGVYALRARMKDSRLLAYSGIGISVLIILFYAHGTHERNKIWSSSESLWHDVTVKSPNNPRGLMNYGLALMAKGELDEAMEYYDRALAIWPSWVYLHINKAILLEAQNNIEEADKHFKYALQYGPDNPDSYYFYGRSLFTRQDYDAALALLKKGIKISPYHSKLNQLLPVVEKLSGSTSNSILDLEERARLQPGENSFLDLSLAYYRNKQYEDCIDAARRSVEFNAASAAAYNNICAAYCAMKQWDKALEACNQALEINPDFERAKNNRNWALNELKKSKP